MIGLDGILRGGGGASDALILKINKAAAGSFSIFFEAYGVTVPFDFKIKWGDGAFSSYKGTTSTTMNHQYSAAGLYYLEITGTCPNFNFYNSSTKLDVVGLISWGNVGIQSMYYTFYLCTNFSELPQDMCLPPLQPNMNYSFYGYRETNITHAVIPEGTTIIPRLLFGSCPKLLNILVAATVVEIADSAFVSSALTSFYCPASLRYIRQQAFGYSLLSAISLNEGLLTIGDAAFYGTSAVQNSFASFAIPSTVTAIGSYAFNNNFINGKKITCYAAIPPTAGTAIFGQDVRVTSIKVPAASVAAYKAASGWSTYATKIIAI